MNGREQLGFVDGDAIGRDRVRHDDAGRRADRVIERVRAVEGDVLLFGHGHFSRSVMTRWVELPISEGIRVSMAAASIAVCGFEHGVRQITALGLTGHVNPCLPP